MFPQIAPHHAGLHGRRRDPLFLSRLLTSLGRSFHFQTSLPTPRLGRRPFINSELVSIKPRNPPPETGSWLTFPSAGPPVGHEGKTTRIERKTTMKPQFLQKQKQDAEQNRSHFVTGRDLTPGLKVSKAAPAAYQALIILTTRNNPACSHIGKLLIIPLSQFSRWSPFFRKGLLGL